MTNYRRSNIAGASYFFTVNLADRSSRLLIEQIALLRTAFEYTRSRRPFTIDAIVILPDHLHVHCEHFNRPHQCFATGLLQAA